MHIIIQFLINKLLAKSYSIGKKLKYSFSHYNLIGTVRLQQYNKFQAKINQAGPSKRCTLDCKVVFSVFSFLFEVFLSSAWPTG